jgi:hypothetical protein
MLIKTKYSTNQNIMNEIDSEEKAYWLGFFYADAYNKEKTGQIIIELQEQDHNHLIKCAQFFGKPRDPFKQLKNGGKYTSYRLELNGRTLSNSLKSKGCHGGKSFDIIFPSWLESPLIKHFIRGYFDGDGCIYIHQKSLGIEFVSTKEMILSIQNILETELQINSHITKPKRYKNNTYRLDFGGNLQSLRFCNWIYDNSTIYLDRKYKLFKEFNFIYQEYQNTKNRNWSQELKDKIIKLKIK